MSVTKGTWSKPTEGLLRHKSHKIVMIVMEGMFHITQDILCMGLCNRRPVRVPMTMTPVHRRKPLQWVHEHWIFFSTFSKIIHPATLHALFRNGLRNMMKSSRCCPALQQHAGGHNFLTHQCSNTKA